MQIYFGMPYRRVNGMADGFEQFKKLSAEERHPTTDGRHIVFDGDDDRDGLKYIKHGDKSISVQKGCTALDILEETP